MRKVINSDKRNKIEIDFDNKHFRLEKWDNEVNFEIETTDNHRTNHYEIKNGYEFETILDEKPKTNFIKYKLKSKGVKFYYQSQLTEQEIEAGCKCPENVIGSYAVYHENKKNNQYKTGKVGHIYRPKITDNSKNWIWGEMEIKGEFLYITIPQTFLDTATYPIIIDPTFGYSEVGKKSRSVYEYQLSIFGSGGSGDVSKITAYCYADGSIFGDSYMKAIIHQTNGTIVAATGEILETSADWHDFTYTTEPSISNQDYYLTLLGDGNAMNSAFYYDDGDEDDGGEADNGGSFATPGDLSNYTDYSRIYSIYATYEAAAATYSGTGYNWSFGEGAHNFIYATGQGFGWSVGAGDVTYENLIYAEGDGYNWSVGQGDITYYNILAVTGEGYNWSVGDGQVSNILIATGEGYNWSVGSGDISYYNYTAVTGQAYNWSVGQGTASSETIIEVEGQGFNWSVGAGDISYYNILAVAGQGFNWSVSDGAVTNILLGAGIGFNWSVGAGFTGERAVTEKPKVTGGRIRKRNYDIFINIPEIKAEMTIQPRIREVELLENHLKQNKRIVL